MRDRLVDVADTTLHLNEWGDEDAPPILFWHALGSHTSLQMLEAAPILVEEFGYRVVGVDAPGFGDSPQLPDERYEMGPLVDLARELLDEIGLERPVWSGSSWGASLGVQVAASHPDRVAALVLLDGGYMDPAIGEGETLAELKAHWGAQPGFHYESWEEMLAEAKEYFNRWTPGVEAICRDAFREEGGAVVSIMGPDVYAAAIYGIQQTPPSEAHERLGRAGVPVLALVATEPARDEERRAAALARFSELVPQADVRRLEGAPHFLLEDRPDEIARTVGEWLRSLA